MHDPTDEKLFALAAVMKERLPLFDARLERLAFGQLSDAEVIRLRTDAISDPTLGQFIEVLSPFPADFQDRLVAIARQAAGGGEIVPLAVHRDRRRGLVSAAVLVLAAACAFAVFRPVADDPRPLPDYHLSFEATSSEWRGHRASYNVTPSTRLNLVMRPEITIEHPLDVRLIVVQDDEVIASETSGLDVQRGAIRWSGTMASLAPKRYGRMSIAIVVAKSGRTVDDRTALTQEGGDSWRVQSIDLKVMEPCDEY